MLRFHIPDSTTSWRVSSKMTRPNCVATQMRSLPKATLLIPRPTVSSASFMSGMLTVRPSSQSRSMFPFEYATRRQRPSQLQYMSDIPVSVSLLLVVYTKFSLSALSYEYRLPAVRQQACSGVSTKRSMVNPICGYMVHCPVICWAFAIRATDATKASVRNIFFNIVSSGNVVYY